MLRSIKYFITFTILIGVLGLSLNAILGNQTITYVEKIQVDTLNTHFYIWKFNFWNYIENIQLNATNTSVLIFKLPTREFSNDLINNLALIMDYLIVLANVLLYPIKITAYLLQNILAIVGINRNPDEYNGLYWLYQFVHDILGNFAIPYI